LQNPSEIKVDNLYNEGNNSSRHIRKKREYSKDKINESAMNSKGYNIGYIYRGINKVWLSTLN
jgi:hypothetical protein